MVCDTPYLQNEFGDPRIFYIFNLILSFSTCSQSFKKFCAWELLGANVLKSVPPPRLFLPPGSPRSSNKVSPDWRPLFRFNKRTNNRNNSPKTKGLRPYPRQWNLELVGAAVRLPFLPPCPTWRSLVLDCAMVEEITLKWEREVRVRKVMGGWGVGLVATCRGAFPGSTIGIYLSCSLS